MQSIPSYVKQRHVMGDPTAASTYQGIQAIQANLTLVRSVQSGIHKGWKR